MKKIRKNQSKNGSKPMPLSKSLRAWILSNFWLVFADFLREDRCNDQTCLGPKQVPQCLSETVVTLLLKYKHFWKNRFLNFFRKSSISVSFYPFSMLLYSFCSKFWANPQKTPLNCLNPTRTVFFTQNKIFIAKSGFWALSRCFQAF